MKPISSKLKLAFKNISALSVLQVSTYIIPLLLLPYVIRVLGVEGFGVATYIIAVISFFMVFVDYGFNLSATRSVSINRENDNKLSEIFFSVLLIKLAFSLIGLILLLLFFFIFSNQVEHKLLYLTAYITVFGHALSPVFFYQGIERMVTLTKIGVLAKILGLIASFSFINESDDIFEYIFIFALSYLAPSLILIYLALNNFNLQFTTPSFSRVVGDLKDGASFFGVSAMSSILSSAGIVFLGVFSTKEVVGSYSAVERLVKAALSFFAPINQAFYPYSASIFARKFDDGIAFIKKLAFFIFAASLFTCSLMILLSEHIVSILYGSSVEQYASVFLLLTPWFILSLLNNCYGVQFMSNAGLSNLYFYFFLIAGVFCISLYYFLIPYFGFKGVAYSMAISELMLFVMLFTVFCFRNKLIKVVN